MNFNEFYLNDLFDKLFKESKTVSFLGDVDKSLQHYEQDSSKNAFFDSTFFHLFPFQILPPARVRDNSKTLLDNIFSNAIPSNIIPGNVTLSVSDHLPRFVITSNIFLNPPSLKYKIYKRKWSKYDQPNFIFGFILFI